MTVTGTILEPNGDPMANRRIEFIPVRTPVATGSGIVFTKRVAVTTDADGEFSVTLQPGIYQVDHRLESVVQNTQAPIFIRVSNEAGPEDWEDLIRGMNQATDFGGLPSPVSFQRVIADDGSIWEKTWLRQGDYVTEQWTHISG